MAEQMVIQDDLTSLVEALSTASSDTPQKIANHITEQMAQEVASRAYAYAPKDTWELARSIGVVKESNGVRVEATAPYAAYVEFGTWSKSVIDPKPGTYEIRPRHAKALRFTGRDGQTVYTKKVEHPGVPAHLFMTRANNEVIDKYSRGIANVGTFLVLKS